MRIYLSLLPAALICHFAYTVLSPYYFENSKSLEKLRKDVDEMTQVVLANPGNPIESRLLSEIIDNAVQKYVTSIWDDLYAIKKALKTRQYPLIASSKSFSSIEERVNYASEDLGAQVISIDGQPVCPSNFLKRLLGMEFNANPPVQMLRTDMETGNCFAFRNDSAIATIKLSEPVLIDKIGLEHIAKKLTPGEDNRAAPKDFSVFAISENGDELLGKFRYADNQNKLRQTFDILQSVKKYDLLRFHFTSNHGHPRYTCVYRIFVHGKM
uniref:SUN domain-containing protein n=1 Tax=Glossina morsitans morsitans TaxID=37546 RepID=A0A1B0FCU2_GLOMM